jgi:hypothetical protein
MWDYGVCMGCRGMNSCDNEGELLPFLFPIHICYYYISLLYEIYYYLSIIFLS